MVTEHAIKRYLERILESREGIGELEELKLFKVITNMYKNSREFYVGNFFTQDQKFEFRLYSDNIIMVIRDNCVATMWKINEPCISDVKEINGLKMQLAVIKKEERLARKKCDKIKGAKEFLEANNLKNEELDKEVESCTDECISLDRQIKALELIIALKCYEYSYKNVLREKNNPLAFFINQQGVYNPNRVEKIASGLNKLKERGIYTSEI